MAISQYLWLVPPHLQLKYKHRRSAGLSSLVCVGSLGDLTKPCSFKMHFCAEIHKQVLSLYTYIQLPTYRASPFDASQH